MDGHGTTLTFATSAFAANLIDLGGPGSSRESIETSHMGTVGGKTFEPADLIDNGEVQVAFEFNGDDDPPIDQSNELTTIDWAGSGDTWAFQAHMTNFEPGAKSGERMTATATLKVSGDITITPAV